MIRDDRDTADLGADEELNEDSVGAGDASGLPTMPTLGSVLANPKALVDSYTHCVQCGSNLHFSHLTDFSRNLTQESAKCPECAWSGHRVLHRLQ